MSHSLEDAFNHIVVMMLAKLRVAKVLLTAQEIATFDSELYEKYVVKIDDQGDGVSFKLSLIPKDEPAQYVRDLTTPSLKVIAILLRRVGTVLITEEDIVLANEYIAGNRLVFYGNKDDSCEVSLKSESDALDGAAREARDLPSNNGAWRN